MEYSPRQTCSVNLLEVMRDNYQICNCSVSKCSNTNLNKLSVSSTLLKASDRLMSNDICFLLKVIKFLRTRQIVQESYV